MRALTLTQPWAALVALGIKRIENRDRPLIRRADFGKPFAIHAGKKVDESVYQRIDELWPRCGIYMGDDFLDPTCPQLTCTRRLGHAGRCDSVTGVRDDEVWMKLSRVTSAVIGVATVTDAVKVAGCGPETIAAVCEKMGVADHRRWMFGPTAYITKDNRALATPVPHRGFQGFWTLPDAIAAAVGSQL